jgi:hypothetical protein
MNGFTMLQCSASAATRKRSISACDNCLDGFDLAIGELRLKGRRNEGMASAEMCNDAQSRASSGRLTPAPITVNLWQFGHRKRTENEAQT